MKTKFLETIPVLPSADINRDIIWYEKFEGFHFKAGDDTYAILQRENITIHLQWYADTVDDPLLGDSVIRIFVDQIQPIFDEFVNLGTISKSKLRLNTSWKTHEFGFFDLNKNAIFIVQDI